ncbi:aminopeptidase [Maridesulfovibrio hydrothermalis]|uniref:Leucyl aminopeptidase (Aminopeptidase T) n=1 Tax=Maridesulfovibrio hydrothermalis AM13 = DSM 14728 TaxID=1121451 RepID=L0RCC2_9BACT|nr:aminopeptidase [Maridesulfovibrio hydrothermalis]CCO23221.1 conserved protein of unknown function [Maridesulfovibrio hydrothermalis AM13 = DSM 14728]
MDSIKNLLQNCAGLKSNEKVLIITDTETEKVGKAIAEESEKMAETNCISLPSMNMHGQEPTPEVADLMLKHDVVLGLTRKSLAHTKARFNATQNGSRFLSLPDYSLELLNHKALSFNFRLLAEEANRFAIALTKAEKCKVTTSKGTDISFNLKSRVANSCPGFACNPGELASPPDSEVNIAPLESETNGVIVVDGSIPCDEIGTLNSPITITITDGYISNFEGEKSDVLRKLFKDTGHQSSKILGELGFGLNPNADLCGIMLVDEGCRGTVHFGFGSNNTIGGKNYAPIHLDMVIKSPTVILDTIIIVKNGNIIELP